MQRKPALKLIQASKLLLNLKVDKLSEARLDGKVVKNEELRWRSQPMSDL